MQEVPNIDINSKFKTRAPETKKEKEKNSTPGHKKKKKLNLWHSHFQAGGCRTFIWDTNTDSQENAIGAVPDYFLNEMIHQ